MGFLLTMIKDTGKYSKIVNDFSHPGISIYYVAISRYVTESMDTRKRSGELRDSCCEHSSAAPLSAARTRSNSPLG